MPGRKTGGVAELPFVEQLFGKNRKVAIGFNGVAYFLPDEAFHRSVQVLYDWAGKGSRLFLCDIGTEGATAPAAGLEKMKLYEKFGHLPLEDWVGMKGGVAKETLLERFSMFGAILKK